MKQKRKKRYPRKRQRFVQLVSCTRSSQIAPTGNQSDVAQLLRQIDVEYQAAQFGLTGLALGTSIHEFITARMERIEDAREQLVQLVGDPDEATRLLVDQMNKSDKPEEDKGP